MPTAASQAAAGGRRCHRLLLTVGLDEQATRDQLADAVEHRRAEVASLREQAERQEQQAAESLTRLRRDYKARDLTAAEWREFKDELTGERQAAAAEAKRLRKQEEKADAAAELDDCENEALKQCRPPGRHRHGGCRGARLGVGTRGAAAAVRPLHAAPRWDG